MNTIPTIEPNATSSSRPERSEVERPCLDDKPLIVERRSLDYAACAAPLGTTEGESAIPSSRPERSGAEGPCLHEKPLAVTTPSSRPERSGAEGPCLHHRPHMVERRSPDDAAFQAAPLGTTPPEAGFVGALLRLADAAERRKDSVIGRVMSKLTAHAQAIDIPPTAEAKP